MRFFSSLASAFVVVVGIGCARHEPPSSDSGNTSAPATRAASASGSASASASASGPSSSAPALPASSAPSVLSSDAAASAELTGVDSGALPQTHDEPEARGAAFDGRVQAMWEAIVQDNPDRGLAFFFPLAAYEQVKAIANPALDWRRRLVAAYARDIHALHAKLGAGAANAHFVALEVPKERSRWVNPGEEYNKLGYFRVFGSKLRYEINGTAGSFDIASLISWRGEWYVVHLGSIH